jgi:hypothetical protein
MTQALKAQTRWARHEAGGWWTLALNTPVDPGLMAWLATTYKIEQIKTLKTGAVALLLRSSSSNLLALMELPKPKGQGSRHECNDVCW